MQSLTESGPSTLRVLAGLIIAPVVPALLMYLGQMLIGGLGTYQMALFILMFGFPLSLVVGLPTYFLGLKHVHRAWPFACIGGVIGLMGYGIFFALTQSNPVYTNDLRMALLKNTASLGVLGLICGIISGLAFWYVVVRSSR
jgi:hypothetical protein